jgi:hypothetical protein
VKFEYKMLYERWYGWCWGCEFDGMAHKDKGLMELLNILGRDGWQIASTKHDSDGENEYIMMRQIV